MRPPILHGVRRARTEPPPSLSLPDLRDGGEARHALDADARRRSVREGHELEEEGDEGLQQGRVGLSQPEGVQRLPGGGGGYNIQDRERGAGRRGDEGEVKDVRGGEQVADRHTSESEGGRGAVHCRSHRRRAARRRAPKEGILRDRARHRRNEEAAEEGVHGGHARREGGGVGRAPRGADAGLPERADPTAEGRRRGRVADGGAEGERAGGRADEGEEDRPGDVPQASGRRRWRSDRKYCKSREELGDDSVVSVLLMHIGLVAGKLIDQKIGGTYLQGPFVIGG
mmetsp:Transcript_36726/g.68005  ORF Transcript_36726/g.68005 Transcript_36726/m.68005 type:complete len:285 (+) Transcript_36726:201-1055(+)